MEHHDDVITRAQTRTVPFKSSELVIKPRVTPHARMTVRKNQSLPPLSDQQAERPFCGFSRRFSDSAAGVIAPLTINSKAKM